MTQRFFDAPEATVPGTLRGYRAWDLDAHTGRLHSTGISQHAWPLYREVKAVCLPPRPASDEVTWWNHGPTGSPAPECVCGLYGWYSPWDTRIVPGELLGVIQASGRVIMGTHGFKAEKARILALYHPEPKVLLQTGFGDQLRLDSEVPLFDSLEGLLEQFPPDDVSALVTHECGHDCWWEKQQTEFLNQMTGRTGPKITSKARVNTGPCDCFLCMMTGVQGAFQGVMQSSRQAGRAIQGFSFGFQFLDEEEEAERKRKEAAEAQAKAIEDELKEAAKSPMRKLLDAKAKLGKGPLPQAPFRHRGRG